MQITLTKIKALNGKKLIDYSDDDFWNLSLEKYRASKIIRKLLFKKNKHFNFKKLAEFLEVDRHYIYQVLIMSIKPNEDFINKLNEVLNGN